jgi:hypothetical protein
MVETVRATGYPHGLNAASQALGARSFQGEIVADVRRWERLPARPPVYELSFQCPRGLSGAPLLHPVRDKMPTVAGVILGNEIVDMTVYSEEGDFGRGREGKVSNQD